MEKKNSQEEEEDQFEERLEEIERSVSLCTLCEEELYLRSSASSTFLASLPLLEESGGGSAISEHDYCFSEAYGVQDTLNVPLYLREVIVPEFESEIGNWVDGNLNEEICQDGTVNRDNNHVNDVGKTDIKDNGIGKTGLEGCSFDSADTELRDVYDIGRELQKRIDNLEEEYRDDDNVEEECKKVDNLDEEQIDVGILDAEIPTEDFEAYSKLVTPQELQNYSLDDSEEIPKKRGRFEEPCEHSVSVMKSLALPENKKHSPIGKTSVTDSEDKSQPIRAEFEKQLHDNMNGVPEPKRRQRLASNDWSDIENAFSSHKERKPLPCRKNKLRTWVGGGSLPEVKTLRAKIAKQRSSMDNLLATLKQLSCYMDKFRDAIFTDDETELNLGAGSKILISTATQTVEEPRSMGEKSTAISKATQTDNESTQPEVRPLSASRTEEKRKSGKTTLSTVDKATARAHSAILNASFEEFRKNNC